ncbi:MAG: tripartite tricarboxylate transporter permease [Proteobacteria bacterium]|nr:tripartite tricarboxylate transporter permease [Pseudomonadota bacterium]
MIEYWLMGIDLVFKWYSLVLLIGGVFIGLSFAALPGLSNTAALVLTIPFVYYMDPISSMIFMAAIYGGGIHGGCMLAILFKIPGEPQSACTTFDGYPMAKQGRSAEAMGIAFLYSSLGGVFGVIACIIFAPLLAKFALAFGPAEYFAFVFFGLSVVSSVGTGSILKGLISGAFGVLLATVGMSETTGAFRYDFNTRILKMGFEFVPIIMGVFAISELIKILIEGKGTAQLDVSIPKWTVKLPSFKFMRETKATFLRSSIIGTLVGFLPGAGATASAFVAYGWEVRRSRHPEKYGKGEPRGVVASETANNASYGGAMIPMLTLGIPGSASTAVMLGVLLLKGIQPSPIVFQQMPDLVYAVFVAMVLTNIIMFFESIFFGRFYLNMLKLPFSIIAFIIVALCSVGTFAIRNSIEDLWIMAIFGVIGYYMEKYGFSAAALVLGVILGRLAESSFIQAVQGFGLISPLPFLTRPISATLILLGILFLLLPVIQKYLSDRRIV